MGLWTGFDLGRGEDTRLEGQDSGGDEVVGFGWVEPAGFGFGSGRCDWGRIYA